MKHSVIEVTYIAPIEKIDDVLPKHREFLQTGYRNGMLLCSGPKNPRIGGIVIARAETEQEIVNFFAGDPYKINNLAEYRITEFNPVLHQEFLNDWIV